MGRTCRKKCADPRSSPSPLPARLGAEIPAWLSRRGSPLALLPDLSEQLSHLANNTCFLNSIPVDASAAPRPVPSWPPSNGLPTPKGPEESLSTFPPGAPAPLHPWLRHTGTTGNNAGYAKSFLYFATFSSQLTLIPSFFAQGHRLQRLSYSQLLIPIK